ncbi:hypothetical protein [Streptomyces sp. NPDC047974]
MITRLAAADITTIVSLAESLADRKPGDEVDVMYVRGSATRKAEVTLGEM